MPDSPRILYCHCAYTKIIPADVKQGVLRCLSESGRSFDTVPDLCEMSARKDPSLQNLAQAEGLKIAACYPRAVKWLFAAAGAPLRAEGVQVLNMRTESADTVVGAILGQPADRTVTEEQP